MRNKNIISILFLFLPFMTLAHGEEVLVWMGIEIVLLIGFILFILLTKQKIKYKLILILIYILSEIGIIWFTKEIPYLNNNVSINIVSFVVPVVLVLGTFFFLKKLDNRL